MKTRLIATAMLMVVFIAVGLFQWASYVTNDNFGPIRSLSPPPTSAEVLLMRAQNLQWEMLKSGGEHYKPLKIISDYPGQEPTELLDAQSVTLPPSTEVVGVEVAGECCAFVLNSMTNPRYHIVNMMINMKPISVTYCNLVDCVRVLTHDEPEIIPLHVGGLDVGNQMVLLYGGDRFGQTSESIPLQDHDFVRTTLGEWILQHPSTTVYVAPDED